MSVNVSKYLGWALLCATAMTLIAGCGKKDDPIAQAERKEVAKAVSAPGIARCQKRT